MNHIRYSILQHCCLPAVPVKVASHAHVGGVDIPHSKLTNSTRLARYLRGTAWGGNLHIVLLRLTYNFYN